MFILTFSAEEEIEKIYQIKNILGCRVEIEALKKSKLVPQCKQCQVHGHTQKYCNRQARCVKCAGKHHTTQCTKPQNVQPKCVHCGEPHPASYRGCTVAIELQNIINKKLNTKNSKNQILDKKQEAPENIKVDVDQTKLKLNKNRSERKQKTER